MESALLPILIPVNGGFSKGIDGARGALILGLIVFHSARVFDSSTFYVKAPTQIEAVTPLVLFGVIWGMPLFFLIAGYSIWHSLNHRGTKGFLRERVTRLLLPFIACVVLFVPPQVFVQRQLSGESVSYPHSVSQFLDVSFVPRFPIPVDGTWFDLGHLWFLGYLFAFTILLLPVLIWFKRRPRMPSLSDRGAVAAWVAAIVAVAAAESLLGTERLGGWNRWTFLVFLTLGVLLATQSRFGELVARRRLLIFACALAGFAGLVVGGEILKDHGDSLAGGAGLAPMLWRAGKGVTAVLFLMAIVGSLVGFESKAAVSRRQMATAKFMAYVKQISLPLYIVHQAFIVVLAYWIVQWAIPPAAQWLALVILTLAMSIASVELAGRTRLGRLLLGMRPRRREPTVASPVPAATPPARQPAAGEPKLVPTSVV
jgi:glucans biosynthesis protein C